jgi:hypothetical protein
MPVTQDDRPSATNDPASAAISTTSKATVITAMMFARREKSCGMSIRKSQS